MIVYEVPHDTTYIVGPPQRWANRVATGARKSWGRLDITMMSAT
jgi:hypothetical protein